MRQATLQSSETNKLLMRRYVAVQKARYFFTIDRNLDDQRISVLSSSNRTPSTSFSQRSQKGVHDQRRKAQPSEACQLCRDRMLRSRRVPRKLDC